MISLAVAAAGWVGSCSPGDYATFKFPPPSRHDQINNAVEYTITETGLTAVVCLPHQAMGMVALVVVGDDLSNAEQVLEARIPGKGKAKIEALIEEARATLPAAETSADQNS